MLLMNMYYLQYIRQNDGSCLILSQMNRIISNAGVSACDFLV